MEIKKLFEVFLNEKEDVKEMMCVGLLSTTGIFLAYAVIWLAYC